MGRTDEEIVSLYHSLRNSRGPLINDMAEVQRHYNGDVTVPLPELDEAERPAVANLLAQGLDQLAGRVASVLPDVVYDSVRPGFKGADQAADDKRKANLGWWQMNSMPRKLRRRARHLIGYGVTPVRIRTDDTRKIPLWSYSNPLSTLVPAGADPDDYLPPYSIYYYTQTLAWLKRNYPEQANRLQKAGDKDNPNANFEMIEYNDEYETVLIVVGRPKDPRLGQMIDLAAGSAPQQRLESYENKAGMPLVVVPGRITLDRLQGHFSRGFLGMYMRQAKLDALEVIAIQRGIFPNEWLVTYPQATGRAQIVNKANGLTGQLGEIRNGQIQSTQINPTYLATQAVDRYERAQRLDAGIPSEFGAESATNVRTAKRGDAVMAAAVDMPIAEYQDIFAASLQIEDEIAIAQMKGNWGSRPTSFYVPRSGKVARTDYTPNDLFDSDVHVVKYSFPGMDVNGLSIMLGTKTQTGEMSMQTAREIDPFIEDAKDEGDRVEAEGLRKALLMSLEQQAAAPPGTPGTLSPIDVARIIRMKLESGTPIEEAILAVHEQTQKDQAAAAATPPEPTQPEGQPGLGGGPAAGPPSPPNAGGLAQILAGLRQPANQSPSERSMAGAPGA